MRSKPIKEKLYVKCKHNLYMTPFVKELTEWIEDQSDRNVWNGVKSGVDQVLISPIITTESLNVNYLNLILDLDVKDSLDEAFKTIDLIFKHTNDFNIFFTGNRGYHLHYKYLLKYDPKLINYNYRKNALASALPRGVDYNIIDIPTSVKDTPILVFGKRVESKKILTPIEYKNLRDIDSYHFQEISQKYDFDDYKQIIADTVPTEYIEFKNIHNIFS